MADVVPSPEPSTGPPWRDSAAGMSVAFFGRPHGDPTAALASIGEAELRHAALRQVHSATVLAAFPGVVAEGDGLWTSDASLALLVVTADCVPVLLGDGQRIAALHAGWRGLASGILAEGLRAFGTSTQALVAWIGPAIGPCCYEVSADVASAVAGGVSGCTRPGPRGRPFLDLPGVTRRLLRRSGVKDIRLVGRCTRCSSGLNSYRRDGPGAGRNLSFIWRSSVQVRDRLAAGSETPSPGD